MYFFHAYPYFWLDFLRSEFWLEIIIPLCKSTLRNTKMVSEFKSDWFKCLRIEIFFFKKSWDLVRWTWRWMSVIKKCYLAWLLSLFCDRKLTEEKTIIWDDLTTWIFCREKLTVWKMMNRGDFHHLNFLPWKTHWRINDKLKFEISYHVVSDQRM